MKVHVVKMARDVVIMSIYVGIVKNAEYKKEVSIHKNV